MAVISFFTLNRKENPLPIDDYQDPYLYFHAWNNFKAPSRLYRPEKLIVGFSEVIWTERYAEPGEFLMTFPYRDEIKKLLPLGSLVSHSNTRDVMIVKTHEIKKVDKRRVLEVWGDSFLTILKYRVSMINYPYSSGRADTTGDFVNGSEVIQDFGYESGGGGSA